MIYQYRVFIYISLVKIKTVLKLIFNHHIFLTRLASVFERYAHYFPLYLSIPLFKPYFQNPYVSNSFNK